MSLKSKARAPFTSFINRELVGAGLRYTAAWQTYYNVALPCFFNLSLHLRPRPTKSNGKTAARKLTTAIA